MGENGQYRVVGTMPEMFSQMLQSTFSAGENFKQQDFRSAVIGADVAKHLNLKVGDSFQPQHGVGGEKHIAFKIVGVLDRTSTPIDRAAFCQHGRIFLDSRPCQRPCRRGAQTRRKGGKPRDEVLDKPLPENLREVTDVLIRTASIGSAPTGIDSARSGEAGE